MESIEFNESNFGICRDVIAWASFDCPYCNKYYSNSFLFELEKGKSEYIGTCHFCRKELKILMESIQKNDALLRSFILWDKELMTEGNSVLDRFIGDDEQ